MITINARGARTIAESKPLIYGGHKVYVTVGDQIAELHLGGCIVAERPARDIRSILAAQDWAYEVIESVPGVSVDEYNEAVHGPSAEQVRINAQTALDEAERLDCRAQVVASAKSGCTDLKNPRHPQNKAKRIREAADFLRKDAEILAAWTARDEAGYSRYISDGMADTDGWCVAESRAMWKRHDNRR